MTPNALKPLGVRRLGCQHVTQRLFTFRIHSTSSHERQFAQDAFFANSRSESCLWRLFTAVPRWALRRL